MKEIFLSHKFEKKFGKIKKTNRKLEKEVRKTIDNYIKNPFIPSLRFHKVGGKRINLWSISVNMSIRITLIIDGENSILQNVGNNDEVY